MVAQLVADATNGVNQTAGCTFVDLLAKVINVWPYAKGTVRGISFLLLHRIVPEAAMRDPKLYEMLALLGAIRDGRVREREI
jgi:hypothetical protein